jgi:ketosteroid isomerase-like protein
VVSEQNKRIAIGFIEAQNRGDSAAAAALFAPDLKHVAMGFSRAAGTRTFDQMVAAVGYLKTIVPEGIRSDIKTVTAEADRVVVEWEGTSVLADGNPYCNQYVFVFTIRDGKIKEVHEYFCSKLTDEVLWPAIAKVSGQA